MAVRTIGIQAAISGIGRDTQRRIAEVERVVRETTENAEQTMKQAAPRLTSETAESITHDVQVSDAAVVGRVGPTNRDAKGRPVAMFIEFGTASSPPVPFVGPVAEFYRQQFIQSLRRV